MPSIPAVPAFARTTVIAAAAAFAAPAAAAEPAPVGLHYTATLLGLTIASVDLGLTIGDGRYRTRLDWRTRGLLEVFAGSRGTVEARGSVAEARPRPADYTLAGGRRSEPLDVHLVSADGVTRIDRAEPPMRPKPDTVPLGPSHFAGTVDPLSALIMAAPRPGGDACDRTLPILDGWTRYDLRLAAKAKEDVRRAGLSGPIAVCGVRYLPIAGHSPRHKPTKFLTEATGIEIALARLDATGTLVPVRATIPTLIGTAVVELDRITPATAPAR